MILNINRLDSKAVMPSISSNGLDLTCMEILTEPGKDNRVILIYRTGIELEIPNGFMGILTPVRLSPIYSLVDAAGIQVFNSGFKGEIIGRYKINTDGLPSIFEPNEIFARLIIVPVEELSINDTTAEQTKNDSEETNNVEQDNEPTKDGAEPTEESGKQI